MTLKEKLVSHIELAEKELYSIFAVMVTVPNCESYEVIINEAPNFKSKADYYRNAYDDELRLKACKDIKIVSWCMGDSYQDVEDAFYGDNE